MGSHNEAGGSACRSVQSVHALGMSLRAHVFDQTERQAPNAFCALLSMALRCAPKTRANSICSECSQKFCREGASAVTSTRGERHFCCSCDSKRRLQRFVPAPVPREDVLHSLGIDVQTFRKLRQLQAREITPDDYDLLMSLHAKSNSKVLTEQQLSDVGENFVAGQAADTCSVCLGAMAAGEKLCRLACRGRHVFHSHCIDEWLTTASRCCPIDQQDLAELCSSA